MRPRQGRIELPRQHAAIEWSRNGEDGQKTSGALEPRRRTFGNDQRPKGGAGENDNEQVRLLREPDSGAARRLLLWAGFAA